MERSSPRPTWPPSRRRCSCHPKEWWFTRRARSRPTSSGKRSSNISEMRESGRRDPASSAAVKRPHTRTPIVRRTLAFGGALLIVAGVSACGGDDDDSASATTAAVVVSTDAPVDTTAATAGGGPAPPPPFQERRAEGREG